MVNNIQISIILMYPVLGKYLDIPIKLKDQIRYLDKDNCGDIY